VLAALALLALVLMVAARRPARARLETIAGDVRRISTDRLALTWQALGLLGSRKSFERELAEILAESGESSEPGLPGRAARP